MAYWMIYVAYLLDLFNHAKGDGGLVISAERTMEVCNLEQFRASCASNAVVHITKAKFGHLHLGRCIPLDLGHFGCSADVTNVIDTKCTANSQCQFEMPDRELDRSRPCSPALGTFLFVKYRCITGRQEQNICQGIQVTKRGGFITSLSAVRAKCSGHQTTSQVRLLTSDSFRILLDVVDTEYNYTAEENSGLLPEYVSIAHGISINKSNVEAAYRFRTWSYESEGSELTVTFSESEIQDNLVLSFRAIGCLDYRAKAGLWQQRSGDDVTIGCSTTDQTWVLHCVDNDWVGGHGNCSVKSTTLSPPTTTQPSLTVNQNKSTHTLSRGVLLTLIVSSTLLLCALVITVACIYIKCLKVKYRPGENQKANVQYALSPQDAALLLGSGIHDGGQRASWHNTMPLPQNNEQPGIPKKDYMTMNVMPIS